jgi:hypothetical protein
MYVHSPKSIRVSLIILKILRTLLLIHQITTCDRLHLRVLATSSRTPQHPLNRRVTQPAAASGSMPRPPPPGASRHVSPTKNKGAVRGRKRKRGGDDEAYRDHPDLTAEKLVQRVMYNPTAVEMMLIYQLSAGVGTSRTSRCYRHRPSLRQPTSMSVPSSLSNPYASDLIEPPACTNPGYGKLQVGIYIAAIQDTIDSQK